MADKDLKSLTIDGTTFRNLFTDVNIGSSQGVNKYNVNLPANTEATGNPLTIDEPGLYFVGIFVGFKTASTTGQTIRVIKFKRTVGSTTTNSTPISWNDASNFAINHGFNWMLDVTETPIVLTPIVLSQRAGEADYIYIFAFKFAKYPGVGRGVVRLFRTLINSICYRPQFGWEVA